MEKNEKGGKKVKCRILPSFLFLLVKCFIFVVWRQRSYCLQMRKESRSVWNTHTRQHAETGNVHSKLW